MISFIYIGLLSFIENLGLFLEKRSEVGAIASRKKDTEKQSSYWKF